MDAKQKIDYVKKWLQENKGIWEKSSRRTEFCNYKQDVAICNRKKDD
ncbi:hypothetical protein ANCCAN_00252 [Ancylostoma caninum]|uniref:Uncharacterized protein n=1 Tax=Ancylostoma caninum TaxID=29170 RepID=A0A368HDJ2_ANCCA|nr:hypothetical protein ANCCAN_00252 [Ancylostoma caninum]